MAKTGAQRQAAHVAKGKQVSVVITDPQAIAALASLSAKHGGSKPAITFALIHATSFNQRPR